MAGLGKIVKQAERMKRGLEALQAQIAAQRLDVTGAGGAVKIAISGSGEFLSLALDPGLLKKEPKHVADTILAAVQDAVRQAREHHEAEMRKISGEFTTPGSI